MKGIPLGFAAFAVLSYAATSVSVAGEKPREPLLEPDRACRRKGPPVVKSADGELIVRMPGRVPYDNVQCLAFSPNSRWLASGNGRVENWSDGEKGEIKVWDLQTQSVHAVLRLGSWWYVTPVAFLGDSSSLVCATFSQRDRNMKAILQFWDVDNAREKWHAELPWENITCLATSKNGEWVATGTSRDKKNIYIWNATKRDKPLVLNAHKGSVQFVGFTADSRVLVSAGSNGAVHFYGTQENG